MVKLDPEQRESAILKLIGIYISTKAKSIVFYDGMFTLFDDDRNEIRRCPLFVSSDDGDEIAAKAINRIDKYLGGKGEIGGNPDNSLTKQQIIERTMEEVEQGGINDYLCHECGWGMVEVPELKARFRDGSVIIAFSCKQCHESRWIRFAGELSEIE